MATRTATSQQVWAWLEQVPDPEIPVISVVELGIVRDVAFEPDGLCVVTITPTYSGCPAMIAIADDIGKVLAAHGVARSRLDTRLAPAWTTDWMRESGRSKLKEYGIAPPRQLANDYQTVDIGSLLHHAPDDPVACPRCGSTRTRLISRFGSTACKALHVCRDCREPFDHFKSH
jgi:ring-1,2-phenylacetyl-CoA epoxidase subunit PaaD